MATKSSRRRLTEALLLSNAVSLILFGLRVVATDKTQYYFLFWNLLLAWVPVLAAWYLVQALKTRHWQDPVSVVLTVLWLGFLPNSFYLMSDLIHLQNTGDINVLFDAVLFLSCIWNGLIAGILSTIWVHQEIRKRHSPEFSGMVIAILLFLCSFAIYLGRSLRWNTWDLLVSPAALVFDVSEPIVNPLAHLQAFLTTATFFVLIGSMYVVVWNFVQTLPKSKQ